MIELDIRDYCHECLDFTADVEKPHRDDDDGEKWSDTVIRCKNAKRCDAIKRYLEKQTKGGNE